jgi:predicted enzyme related to lactoylglutathione lyase
MKVTAVKTILLAVDMRRALEFYETVFAFQRRLTRDHWCEMEWGDAILAIHGGHNGTENRVSLSIAVDDIQGAAAKVQLNGGHMVLPPIQREGEPFLYSEFADTEGNVVMMTQYVSQ